MIKIIYKHPNSCLEERKFLARWLFEEIFGWKVEFEVHQKPEQILMLKGAEGELMMPDVFFTKAEIGWLKQPSLPILPLPYSNQNIPIIYSEKLNIENSLDKENIKNSEFDILGSLFFLITRYEEAVLKTEDQHARFSSTESLLADGYYPQKAIGNAYIEILWDAFKKKWNQISRKKRCFQIKPSHDIDFPSAFWKASVRRKASLVWKAQKTNGFIQGAKTFSQAFAYPHLGWQTDPFDNLDWIMDQSEKVGVKSVFYYIPEKTAERLDPGMSLSHPHVQDQWHRIFKRGHEIGVHPGYNTFRDYDRMRSSCELLRLELSKDPYERKLKRCRQHFLRWDALVTPANHDSCKLLYDSSVGYVDAPGFRAGVCYDYPMYDLKNRKPLKIRQEPLIVMDCSVIDERYMGFGSGAKAFDAIISLKEECKKYNGTFTILWHNQRFVKQEERKLYEEILAH